MLTLPMITIVVFGFCLLSSIHILKEYERGVIFRLGRLLPEAKDPGLILVFAPLDGMVRVSLRIGTIEVPPAVGSEGDLMEVKQWK